MSRIALEPVDRVEITVLMDNVTDALLVDQEAVRRVNWPRALHGALPTASARVSPETGVPDALVAEPGFAALVRVAVRGRGHTLLFDTGVSPTEWSRTCAASASTRARSRRSCSATGTGITSRGWRAWSARSGGRGSPS